MISNQNDSNDTHQNLYIGPLTSKDVNAKYTYQIHLPQSAPFLFYRPDSAEYTSF